MKQSLFRMSQRVVWASRTFHAPLAAIAITSVGCILSQGPGWAQLIPDTSLGGESSAVVPNVTIDGLPSDRIDGGAVRGSNLFHSFDAFNVPSNRGVYFANPAGVETIINRVTGNTATDILGTLGVLGNADVFLINPNGILFGPGAQLDVNGSFVASTASRIEFTDGLQFSATNPQAPTLLTISTPVGLQFGANLGSIQVQGPGHNLRTESNSPNDPIVRQGTFVGLEVPMSETLGLIGGNVSLEGGNVRAEAGRVELGGVGNNSRVSLSSIPTGWAMGYGDTSRFSDVQLSQAASVDANGAGAGTIQIQGQRISLTEASIVQTNTLGSQSSGALQVNASEQVELIGSVENTPGGLFTRTFGTGQAANVTVITPRLLAQDGSRISAASYGEGNAGNLTINASESVEVVGTTTVPPLSGLFVNTLGTGSAGELTINTRILTVRDRGMVSTATDGAGPGGRLTVNGSESVNVIGGVLLTRTRGSQPAGVLSIRTGRLLVQDGAIISTFTDGGGQGGKLTILASESVEVIDSSLIDTATFGAGHAGDFFLETERLTLQGGGFVSTESFAEGNAGDFAINALVIEAIGETPNGSWASGIFAQVLGGTGNSGELKINTQQLIVRDGAVVSAGHGGQQGQAGNITIHADEFIEITGIGPVSFAPSEIITTSRGNGDAGSLSIVTERLMVRDGGQLDTESVGGRGGRLTINASESVSVIGIAPAEILGKLPEPRQRSTIFTNAQGDQPGGDLTIRTGQLLVQDGGIIVADNGGSSQGGQLTIEASESVEVTGFAETFNEILGSIVGTGTQGVGSSGDFFLETERLTLQDGGQVSASTFAIGDAGDFTINSSVIEAIGETNDGDPSGIFSQVITGGTGNGGNLRINTEQLMVKEGAVVSVSATQQQGRAGNLTINASEFVEVTGIAPLSRNPSEILAASASNQNSGILSIQTRQLFVRDSGRVSVRAFGTGAAGNLSVDADLIRIENNAELSAETAAGQGNITLNSQSLQLFRNGNITTNATGEAGGGNITVTTDTLTAFEDSDITANAVEGPGGNIQITTQGLFQSSDSDITASSEIGVDGIVDIQELGTDPEQGLVELPAGIIDPDTLIATSCLAPSARQQGRFRIVGTGGLSTLPNDLASSPFPTLAVPPAGEAEASNDLANTSNDLTNTGQELDQLTVPYHEPIFEADGMYQLEDDSLVFGRTCDRQ